MHNCWKYIRAIFEEKYVTECGRFECVKVDVERGYSKCICMPCVAINYIANEIKFYQREYKGLSKWDFEWNLNKNEYLVKKTELDWNVEIKDLKEAVQMKMLSFDDSAEVCYENQTDYNYIKIRHPQSIIDEIRNDVRYKTLEDDKLFSTYIMELEFELRTEKEQIENNASRFFILFARDYRLEYDMDLYVNALFRLMFFLHPFPVLKVIDKMKNIDDDAWLMYNKKLLDDYTELAKKSAENKNVSPSERIALIENFIGVNLEILYTYFKDSEKEGGVEGINDMLKEKTNTAEKTATSSLVRRLYKRLNKKTI